MQEVIRTVHGVYDPGPATGTREGSTLFTKDSVLGAAAAQLFQDVGLSGAVGGCNHIGHRCLPFALQPAHPHEQRQLSCLPHQGAGQLVVVE